MKQNNIQKPTHLVFHQSTDIGDHNIKISMFLLFFCLSVFFFLLFPFGLFCLFVSRIHVWCLGSWSVKGKWDHCLYRFRELIKPRQMNSTVLKRNNPLQQNHSPHTLFQLPKSWIGYNGIISPRDAEANSVNSLGSSTYTSFCKVFCGGGLQVNLVNRIISNSRLMYSLLCRHIHFKVKILLKSHP